LTEQIETSGRVISYDCGRRLEVLIAVSRMDCLH
jgi:hypothetical protein